MRTPTSARPAVTASGTAFVLGSSSVSGPGQNAPISLRARPGISSTSLSSIARSADVHNHRIPRRPLLGLKNPSHRSRIQRIRSQPIDGLGWQRHQPACRQNLRRPVQSFLGFSSLKMRRVHNQSQRLHSLIVARRIGCPAFSAKVGFI